MCCYLSLTNNPDNVSNGYPLVFSKVKDSSGEQEKLFANFNKREYNLRPSKKSIV